MQNTVIEMVSKCKTLCNETTQLWLHLSFEHLTSLETISSLKKQPTFGDATTGFHAR